MLADRDWLYSELNFNLLQEKYGAKLPPELQQRFEQFSADHKKRQDTVLVPSLDASSEPLTEPELDYCFTLLKSGSVELANLYSRVANTIKILTHRSIEGKAHILYLLDQ